MSLPIEPDTSALIEPDTSVLIKPEIFKPIKLDNSKTKNKDKFNEIVNPSTIDGIEKPPYGIMMINNIPYFYAFPKIKRNKLFRSVFHSNVFSPDQDYCSDLEDYFVLNIDLRKYRSHYVRYNGNLEMFETVIEIRLDDNETKIDLLDFDGQRGIMFKDNPTPSKWQLYKNVRDYLTMDLQSRYNDGNSETTSNGGKKRSRRRKSKKRSKKSRKNTQSRGRK
jgi:hypothetical protein